MREIFFDRAEAARRPNGVIAIVLQMKSKVRGGKPEPVEIVTCRQAGGLALLEALFRVLRK